jgi:hypothetical protein
VGIIAHGFSPRAILGAIGAVAAVILIAASFSTLFSTNRPHSGLTATSMRQVNDIATGTPLLAWRTNSLPVDFVTQPQQPLLAVAPGDGRVAYTCLLAPVSGGTRPAIWRTDDRAATWARVGALPITRSDLLNCVLTLDEGEPVIAVASVSYGAFYYGAPDHVTHFVTFDRGATWTPFVEVDGAYYDKLVTWQKMRFALRNIDLRDQPDQDLRLVTSVDNMQSWQRIDTPLRTRGLHVINFWLDGATGALVAMAGSATSGIQFWRSTNQGATWTLLSNLPTTLGAYAGGFARLTGTWSFCAIIPVGVQPLSGNCTTAGKAWKSFHRPTPEISVSILPDDTRGIVEQMVFKRDDGALVIGVMDTDHTMNVLRFDPVRGTWAALGRTTAASLSYAPNASGGAGILWAIPYGGKPGSWGATVQTTTVPFQS